MTQEEIINSGFRRPRWTLVWTLLAIAIVFALTYFTNELNESANIQPAYINLLKLLTIFVTGVVWFFWLAFFSGHRQRIWFSIVALVGFMAFLYGFRVVLDGDLGFVRLEPRFMERTFVEPSVERDKSAVALTANLQKDFNQFLGNERDGIVRGRTLSSDWAANPPKVLWRQSVGEGWSGFAAVNGYGITQEQRGQDECVTCYEIKTGELVWIYRASRRHEDTLAMGKVGPRATPTIDNGKIYAQGATGVLDCIDGKDGSLIWSINIADLLGTDMEIATNSQGFEYQFEDSRLAWGRSGSPLIYNDMVIATGGKQSDGAFATLIAFDKNSGTEIWRGGSMMIAYGSPAINKLLGRDQVTIVAEAAAIGLDPATGDTLWETARPGHSGQNANCSQVTRLSDNRVLLTKGYDMGGELVELSEGDDGITTKSIWKSSRVFKTKMTSPVVLGDFAYSLTDGFLECSSLENDEEEGRRMWRKRGRFGNGQLLLVGKHLLVHTEKGVLKLVEATPDRYNELGEIKTINGICWNTICLYDNFLLVRSELEAACIELTLADQTAETYPPIGKEQESSEGSGVSATDLGDSAKDDSAKHE